MSVPTRTNGFLESLKNLLAHELDRALAWGWPVVEVVMKEWVPIGIGMWEGNVEYGDYDGFI